MVSKTNEEALEGLIESHLAGANGFATGSPADYDAQFAVDTRYFWQFLEDTQPEQLDKLRKYPDWQRKILERFDRLIKKHGILHMLKKGLAVDDAFFNLMYPAPLASSSQSVVDNFAANIFSVTRQLRYSLANPLQEIDMVLFINGIALVSLELKNPWTGQKPAITAQSNIARTATPPNPCCNLAVVLCIWRWTRTKCT